MRGLERRIEAGLDPAVPSVASIFISRWDVAVADEVPQELRNRLGIAVAKLAYRAYRELLDSERWQRLANEGARPQRLLFASTGTKDPEAPETLYVEALAAPFTINTMPDKTLLAFAEQGEVGEPLPADGGDAEQVLAEFEAAGVERGRARGAPSARGRRGVRRVLERADAVDRSEEPQARGDRVRPAGPPAPRPVPERSLAMQLGMIGLGRMGANMVRRLIRADHECVVFDLDSDAVQTARGRGRGGRRIGRGPGRQARAAPGRVADGARGSGRPDARLARPAARGRRRGDRRRQLLLPGRPAPLGAPGRAPTSTTSTRAPAAGSGGWIAATA